MVSRFIKFLGHFASKSHVILIFFKCRVNLASLNGLPNHCDCAPITYNDLKNKCIIRMPYICH